MDVFILMVEPWAEEILGDLGSYCEVSPSNTGVKAFIKGTLPGHGRNFGDVEMYDTGRYFTVTGAIFNGFPKSVENRGAEITDLYKRLDTEASVPVSPGVSAPGSADIDIENLAVG